MKIGIDAKWLYSPNVSGRLFIQNVLPELVALSPGDEWHIFLDKKDKGKEVSLKNGNIHVHYVWAGLNMLSNIFVVPRYAKRLNLDVVFFQTFSPKTRFFKSVVFIHDVLHAPYPEFFTWKERLYFKVEKLTLPRADRVITTTQYVKDELKKYGYRRDAQPVDLAPLGVSPIFKPLHLHSQDRVQSVAQKFNLPDSYVLFVGRINTRKNIQTLIAAMQFVHDSNCFLVIAGEKSWKAPALKDILNNEGIGSRIIFPGATTDEELSVIYARSKIFCFPSFAEGMGLPPLEAMASGVPAIVSNTTSLPEVCGPAAVYIDPNDPRDIAEKINRLSEDHGLYDEKRELGLAWAKHFTWKNTAGQILRSIRLAVEKK